VCVFAYAYREIDVFYFKMGKKPSQTFSTNFTVKSVDFNEKNGKI